MIYVDLKSTRIVQSKKQKNVYYYLLTRVSWILLRFLIRHTTYNTKTVLYYIKNY